MSKLELFFDNNCKDISSAIYNEYELVGFFSHAKGN